MGGLHIDKDLADYVADNFKNQHQVDIRSNEKSWVKLLHKCADLKETLSANKEANIYIEGIINGLDLNMNVKREVI
jgi:molecular chaperone DnaK (HSP70)